MFDEKDETGFMVLVWALSLMIVYPDQEYSFIKLFYAQILTHARLYAESINHTYFRNPDLGVKSVEIKGVKNTWQL